MLFIFLVGFDYFWCVCVILFLVGILGGVSVCSPHLFSSYARWSLVICWCVVGAFFNVLSSNFTMITSKGVESVPVFEQLQILRERIGYWKSHERAGRLVLRVPI